MRNNEIKVLYICDGKKCNNCSKECFYTTDIRHAASFHEKEQNIFVQNIIQLSQPICDNLMIDEEE